MAQSTSGAAQTAPRYTGHERRAQPSAARRWPPPQAARARQGARPRALYPAPRTTASPGAVLGLTGAPLGSGARVILSHVGSVAGAEHALGLVDLIARGHVPPARYAEMEERWAARGLGALVLLPYPVPLETVS